MENTLLLGLLGKAYGMTLQLLVIVDNYSTFVRQRKLRPGGLTRKFKRLAAQFKLEVQYDPSTYCGCLQLCYQSKRKEDWGDKPFA